MGIQILRVTLGTVNFTNFIHVTASKVGSPSVTRWEAWFAAPLTNFNFIIPNLDPENYYIRYYDAPTNVSLGVLQSELVANALTNEFTTEKKFYTVGGPNIGDPAQGAFKVTDPYLIGKTVTATFKEGFRFYEPLTEWAFNPAIGEIDISTTTIAFSNEEKFMVEIRLSAGTSAPSAGGGGLYSGTETVVETNRALVAALSNKRIRFEGTTATQTITMPALNTMTTEAGFFLDNSVGGLAVQLKILFTGADRLRFNGFMIGSDLFSEFWLSKGYHMLIRKYNDDVWEIITDYNGTNVGEKVTTGFKSHPGIISENGQLIDGDEYPRLWWWVRNVLPATHKYFDDNVTSVFIHNQSRAGQFALHSSLKKFRMPATFGLSEKGLGDFEIYGLDTANRLVDVPGGFQADMIKSHAHDFRHGRNGGIDSNPAGGGIARLNLNQVVDPGWIEPTGGIEQRVKNIGVIFGRRI